MIQEKYLDIQPVRVLKKKELIIKELRAQGGRITSQRRLIIDVILENECSCCKEIYYQALKKDPSVGVATVYRMIKTLEEIGAIDRRNLFAISCDHFEETRETGVTFTDGITRERMSVEHLDWYQGLKNYLKENRMIENDDISVIIRKHT
jgi:Fur family ferric uptake transcriptional regulator